MGRCGAWGFPSDGGGVEQIRVPFLSLVACLAGEDTVRAVSFVLWLGNNHPSGSFTLPLSVTAQTSKTSPRPRVQSFGGCRAKEREAGSKKILPATERLEFPMNTQKVSVMCGFCLCLNAFSLV